MYKLDKILEVDKQILEHIKNFDSSLEEFALLIEKRENLFQYIIDNKYQIENGEYRVKYDLFLKNTSVIFQKIHVEQQELLKRLKKYKQAQNSIHQYKKFL